MSSSTLTNQNPLAMASESVFYPKGYIQLYVEGETDYNFFKRVCDKKSCHIKDCNGVKNVIETIRICNQNNHHGELGVADKDYNEILNRLPKIKNLCYTDTHDMETLILSKNVFGNLLCEYGDENKIEFIENLHGNSIENIIINYCRDIGYTRLFCLQNNVDLDFSKMKVANYVNERFVFDFDKYLDCLIRFSHIPFKEKDLIPDEIDDFFNTAPEYDSWKICQGHDITEFIALFFQKFAKAYKERALDTSAKVEAHLRTLFVNDYFKNTQLYHSMLEWNNNNPAFKLFTI